MLKQKHKTTLYSCIVALTILLSTLLLPVTGLVNGFAKNAYTDKTTITVPNQNFETVTEGTTYRPAGWTASGEFTNGLDKNATTSAGTLDTTLTKFDTNYTALVNRIVASWSTLNNELDATKQEEYKAKLVELLNASKFTNPSIKGFDGTQTENRVLYLDMGKFFNDDYTTSTNREGVYQFTSSEFELGAFKYYRISVDVLTSADAKAFISLNGEYAKFANITNPASSTKAFYAYALHTQAEDKVVILDTAPSTTAGASIVVNGLTYNYSTAQSKYIIDTTQEGYSDALAGSTVTYQSTHETAVPSWKTYDLIVATRGSIKATLSLGLGTDATKSSGYAFFDNVKIEEISERDFATASNGSTTAICNNRRLNVLENFETGSDITDTTFSIEDASAGSTNVTASIVDEETETGLEPTFGANATNKILKIENQADEMVKIISGKFDIKQFKYYRVSLWVLTPDNTNSSAQAIDITLSGLLNGKDKSVKVEKQSPYIKRTNDAGDEVSSINNYWICYNFYITGCPLYDTTGTISLTINKVGTVYIDNFTVEEIQKDECLANASNHLALNTSAITTKDLTNGYFNEYDQVDFDSFNYPLPATGWTIVSTKKFDVYKFFANKTLESFEVVDESEISGKTVSSLVYNGETYTYDINAKGYISGAKKITVDAETFTYNNDTKAYENKTLNLSHPADYIVAGIVPTTDWYNDFKSAIGGVGNPNTTGEKFNYLALYSSTNASFGYRSSSITLSANATYRISMWVNTTASAYISLTDTNGGTLAEFTPITTAGDWTEYVVYFQNGTAQRTAYLTLGFGGETEVTGNVFFAKANVLTYNAASFEEILKKDSTTLASENTKVVSFSSESFAERSEELNTTTNLFDAILFERKDLEGATANGIFGILDTKNAHADYANVKAPTDDGRPFVLVIKNANGEKTKVQSSKTFALTKDTFYKITITAKTLELAESKLATLGFANLSDLHFEVNTNGFTSADTNDYKTYTAYVAVGSNGLTTAFEATLKDSGLLAIADVTFAKITETTYEKAVSSHNETNADEKFLDMRETSTDKNTKTDEEIKTLPADNNGLEIFFLVLSSILLVGAIVFALVATKRKKNTTTYSSKKKNKSVYGKSDDSTKGFV